MKASNDKQVIEMLMPKLRNAVDYVAQKIWNDNKELVRKMIYDSASPVMYRRTGEFKEAWDTEVRMMGNYAEGEFKYDPRELTVNPSMGQHASLVDGSAETEYLAEIIYQGLAGAIYHKGYAHDDPSFSGAWTGRRDVWKELNREIGKAKIRQYFEEGMAHAGLKFKVRRAGIKRTEYYG